MTLEFKNLKTVLTNYSNNQSQIRESQQEDQQKGYGVSRVIYGENGETYSVEAIENVMTEILNVDDFSGVTLSANDDGSFVFSYDNEDGNTYREELTFNEDGSIDIKSTNTTEGNGNVKQSKIVQDDEGHFMKYFDADNNGSIDAAKQVYLNVNSDVEEAFTFTTVKEEDGTESVHCLDNQDGSDSVLDPSTEIGQLWIEKSHLGENINKVVNNSEADEVDEADEETT